MVDKIDTHLIYGFHTLKMLLERAPHRLKTIYALQERDDQRMQDLLLLAQTCKIPIKALSRGEIDKRLPNTAHQGIAAECFPPQIHHEDDLITLIDHLKVPALFLILDGVEDPHNLGACFRTADAAGAHAIITPRNHSASLTPSARKVASGAAEIIPLIQVTNLARCLRMLKDLDIRLIGTTMDAPRNLYQTDLNGSIAIVLGSEGKGMRRLTLEECDELISVPMQGLVTSLNVSVTAGVCLYEAMRQRCFT